MADNYAIANIHPFVIAFQQSNTAKKDKPIDDYQKAIQETKPLSSCWSTYSLYRTPYIKALFYDSSSRLSKIDSSSRLNKLDSCDKKSDTIINGNRYISMLAWKSNDFLPYLKSGSGGLKWYASDTATFTHALFMTIPADMEQWCKKNMDNIKDDKNRTRLRQLLGLPPDTDKRIFIEFWVKPEDIFRPGVDSSLNLCYKSSNISTEYLKAFSKFSSDSFNGKAPFPFTGLEYTWDWNPDNASHVGLSEFVLREGQKKAYVRKKLSTDDFLKCIINCNSKKS